MIASDTPRFIILAGLAAGETLCEHPQADDDRMAVLDAIGALGARVRRPSDGTVAITGTGNGCLLQPAAPLTLDMPDDALLLAGLVAPYDMATEIVCTAGLDAEAVAALLGAFEAMGIQAEADGNEAIVIVGQGTANPAIHDARDWSGPVIAAVMLAALGTPGVTRIGHLPRDPAALAKTFSRFGARIDVSATDNGWSLAITGQTDLRAPSGSLTEGAGA